jgi:outer membrane protein assembly factor BamB
VAAGPGRFVLGDGETHELLVLDLHRRVFAQAVRTAGSFDPANQPATDGDFAAVIDSTGTVTAVDIAAGRVIWEHQLPAGALDTRLQLTSGAVVVSTFAGPVSVLARADGRSLDAAVGRLDGIPVAFALTPDLLVVSLRFGAPSGVVAWPAP